MVRISGKQVAREWRNLCCRFQMLMAFLAFELVVIAYLLIPPKKFHIIVTRMLDQINVAVNRY